MSSLVMGIAGINNGVESWLEGSTSNKESIDVLHGDKLSGVGI